MAVSEQEIQQVTTEIWGSMLDLHPAVTSDEDSGASADGRIGASVQITGGWEGAVRLDSSLALARVAAARFVGTEPEQVSIDQVRDAMGELANMSAGSVKPLLPRPCQLSLPSVADGGDYTLTVPHGEVILNTGFDFEGEPLRIAVLQRKN